MSHLGLKVLEERLHLLLIRFISAAMCVWGAEVRKTCCFGSWWLPWPGLCPSPGAGKALAAIGVPAAPLAGAGEIPGKGQNPARQEQKLSLVTHNWWNICSNFFFSLPLRLGSSSTCQEAAVPVRLARHVEGCAAGTGSVRWGRAGADVVGHGLSDSFLLNPTGLSLSFPGKDLLLKTMK